MNRWPHQFEARSKVLAAMESGENRVCLQIPTGGGKSLVAADLIEEWADQQMRVALYTNRKMLTEQLHRSLARRGISHGVRASGWQNDADELVQICSLQTESGRIRSSARNGGAWQLYPAQRVVIDEGHLHTGPDAQAIRQQHLDQGAKTLDLSATPVDMAGVCDVLIQAGTMSQLRECGAIVWARHFAPDEPDMRAFKRLKESADPSAITGPVAAKAMMTPGIMGRVWKHYERLNPDRTPTILFASGVKESLWFAQQFSKKGVPAAHIDGQDVWVDGDFYPASQTVRDQVIRRSKSGEIAVITNRFVMREGIDMPWLQHCILATIFSALQSYLQAVGRLLRAFGGLEYKTIQDHGGNYWRWGSPNADREWFLELTPGMAYGLRAKRIREKREREPMVCPNCQMILAFGTCQNCGTDCRQVKRSRPVVSTDGTLRDVAGAIFRPRRVAQGDCLASAWERMYYRSKTTKGQRSFAAAMALFAQEHHWQYPNPAWPFMPTDDIDHFRLVADVPYERLVPKEALTHA